MLARSSSSLCPFPEHSVPSPLLLRKGCEGPSCVLCSRVSWGCGVSSPGGSTRPVPLLHCCELPEVTLKDCTSQPLGPFASGRVSQGEAQSGCEKRKAQVFLPSSLPPASLNQLCLTLEPAEGHDPGALVFPGTQLLPLVFFSSRGRNGALLFPDTGCFTISCMVP